MDHIPQLPGTTLSESFSRLHFISFDSCNAGDSCSLFSVDRVDPPGDDVPTGEPPVPSLHALEPPPAEPPPKFPASDSTPDFPAFPASSLIHHILHNNAHSSSPHSLFEFPSNATPFTTTAAHHTTIRPLALWLTELPDFPSVMDSVMRVVGSSHIFVLRTDSSLYAQMKKTSATLIDKGANIFLTGNLNLLADVVEIAPLPILVAINGEDMHINDSCTHREYLPLNLSDGSTHWQLCFYCKNAVETIIPPKPILVSSDVFASWMQTGFKDGRPGWLRFNSHGGLCTMQLDLDYRDGLYYCPTDVFTVNQLPFHATLPRFPAPPCTTRCPSRFSPTSKSKKVQSEVWLLCLGSPGVHPLDVLPGNVMGLPSVFEYHPFCFIDQSTTTTQGGERATNNQHQWH